MAWALQFDGVNDYALFNTKVSESSTKWRLEWRAKSDDPSTAKRIIAKISGSTDYIATRHTSTQEQITTEFNNVTYVITGGTKVTDDGQFHDYSLVADGINLEYFVDGLSKGTVAGSPIFEDFDCIGRGGSSYYAGQVEYFKYYDTSSSDVLKFNWDATASSHASGTPILTDTIGFNNATGVNMPTDGSAWVDLGGGGSALTADSGTYLYTGTDAQLLTTRILKADTGAYLHTGSTVSLLKGFVLTAQSGSYSYLGQDATLTYTPAGAFILTADSGNYTYTGSNINFNRDRVIIASSGTYNYSGTDIQIILPGQIWTDKPSASTNWNNQTVTTTIWTDK